MTRGAERPLFTVHAGSEIKLRPTKREEKLEKYLTAENVWIHGETRDAKEHWLDLYKTGLIAEKEDTNGEVGVLKTSVQFTSSSAAEKFIDMGSISGPHAVRRIENTEYTINGEHRPPE